jgi:hypothetical protein
VEDGADLLPGHPRLLASSAQNRSPDASQPPAEAPQLPEIARHGMILVVAQHHPFEPLPSGLNRLVHPSAQLLFDLLELGPHPLCGRFPPHLKVAFRVLSATLREPKERKRFWLCRTWPFPVSPESAQHPWQNSGWKSGSRECCFPACSGSQTTGDSACPRDDGQAVVAFPCNGSGRHLHLNFRSSIPGPPVALFTLRRPPRDFRRKTRGQDSSLLLSCRALSSPTTCRFILAHHCFFKFGVWKFRGLPQLTSFALGPAVLVVARRRSPQKSPRR